MEAFVGMTAACAILGTAACVLTLWWLRDPVPPRPPDGPLNADPHILTMLGAHGRPNPMLYERLPDYPAAWKRQRELARQGRGSIVTHADSGQIRHDVPGWLPLHGRIGL